MTKTRPSSIAQLFRPPMPLWACEFTSHQVIVAGVDSTRTRVHSKAATALPSESDREHRKATIREILRLAAFKGSEIAVVIPDEAARISFVTAEKLPKNVEEQHTFIRWKLKKSVPFDVDSAQVAFRVVETRPTGSELLVALAPREAIEKYEHWLDELDIHPGIVIPSSMAVLNLMNPPTEDALFVKITEDSVTTTVFQQKHIRFHRRVSGLSLYESVYPTLLYYQDKMGGTEFRHLTVCASTDAREALAELYDKTGISAQTLEPRSVEDIYKPALGAVHLSWANLI